MRLTYVLLSPTFGMHQYTADLANRMAAAGHAVSLVTTALLPRDRYGPEVRILTPLRSAGTGLAAQSLNRGLYKGVLRAIEGEKADVVHFSGPHIWNPSLVKELRQAGIPVVHTIHDLDAHHGRRFGFLLRPWNRAVINRADMILVHGQVYRERLVAGGLEAERVTCTPLLHLFLSYEMQAELEASAGVKPDVSYEPQMLFFGRVEAYKGIEYLLTAYAQITGGQATGWRLVLAGPGELEKVWKGALPAGVEVRRRLIDDEEALALFQRSSLVLLPYIDATQSALVAAAYYFKKPVLVARSGALPEYVQDGETGYIVEPGHPATLARALAAAVGDRDCLRVMGENGRRWYEQRRVEETAALQAMYSSF